jgi:hypothetical protein
MNRAELVRLAQVGAASRLRSIQAEIDAILGQFPDLRTRRSSTSSPPTVSGGAVRGTLTRRRRRPLSAQARKRIEDAQRKRWAEWRAKQTTTEGASHAAKKRSRKKK